MDLVAYRVLSLGVSWREVARLDAHLNEDRRANAHLTLIVDALCFKLVGAHLHEDHLPVIDLAAARAEHLLEAEELQREPLEPLDLVYADHHLHPDGSQPAASTRSIQHTAWRLVELRHVLSTQYTA